MRRGRMRVRAAGWGSGGPAAPSPRMTALRNRTAASQAALHAAMFASVCWPALDYESGGEGGRDWKRWRDSPATSHVMDAYFSGGLNYMEEAFDSTQTCLKEIVPNDGDSRCVQTGAPQHRPCGFLKTRS